MREGSRQMGRGRLRVGGGQRAGSEGKEQLVWKETGFGNGNTGLREDGQRGAGEERRMQSWEPDARCRRGRTCLGLGG